MPAASLVFSISVLLPASVAPSQASVVPETLAVMSTQVAPPSSEPRTRSPAASGAFKVAPIVWSAVFVMKSVALAPLSFDRWMPEKATVGAVTSST